MRRNRVIAVVAALLLVTAGVGVTSAAAADQPLTIDVDQGRQGSVYVTVTSNGTAVEGATVDVEAANATYEGEGGHVTDADGSVVLAVPEEDVTVSVTATDANRTETVTTTLYAPTLDVSVDQERDGSATATVTYAITGDPATGATVNVSTADANETYVGVGEYTTDGNGTISLPAPDSTVAIHLDASAKGVTGSAKTFLQNATQAEETYQSFGARVSAFVRSVLGDAEGGIGQVVADFVTSNNPGNAPDHAGPSADDGDRGPPDFVGDRGAHGGGNETEASSGTAGNPGGPPPHAAGDGEGRGDGSDGHPGGAEGR